jgi:predicted O-methyltransferase YrrM
MTAVQQPATEASPRLKLFQLATSHYISHALYVAAELRLADQMASGPQPCERLAKATSTHAPSLRRLLRLLASAGVVTETDGDRFALTPIGEYLRSDVPDSSRAMALLFAGPMIGSWNELLHAVRTGEKVFERVFGMDPFQYMAAHPEQAATFNEAMTAVSTQTARSVAAAYDFSSFRTIADIGGGYGVLLTTILKANPKLRGILFELPHVAEGAKKQIAAATLSDRCEVIGGSFFETVPKGADAYLLKSVIHDWDDEKSVAILRRCHAAMAPGKKLLLVEVVMPPRIEPSLRNYITTGSDVNMLVAIGGRERTDVEYRSLYEAAGFQLERLIPLEGSLASIIEGVRR